MAEQPEFATADLSCLRLAVVGGAPMPESLLETLAGARCRHRPGLRADGGRAERPVPASGGRGPEAGLSPASPIRTSTSRCAIPRRRAARRRRAPASSSSSGPNVFAGYWRNPEATAAVFADGWLLTGDLAERDDEGYYRIAGRLKDLVISGGENVYPAEIEDVLHAHPGDLRGRGRRRPGRALGRGLRRLRRRFAPDAAVEEEELLEWCARATRALQGAEGRCASSMRFRARR